MTIDKDQLKATDHAASQGHWGQDGFEVHNDDVEDYRVAHCRSHADAAFIAAASPATVLDLLAEIERLSKFEDWFARLEQVNNSLAESFKVERDQLKAENADLRTGYQAYEEVNAGMKAEVEALRKDAERYRAIRDDIPHLDLGRAILDVQTADEYDAAVDAAMAKEAIHG